MAYHFLKDLGLERYTPYWRELLASELLGQLTQSLEAARVEVGKALPQQGASSEALGKESGPYLEGDWKGRRLVVRVLHDLMGFQ